MFTELEKLLDIDQFQELLNTLAETGEYNYSENGYNISAKSGDGTFSIQINYEKPKNLAKEESEKFTEFLNTLDDELFVETCESLGTELITRISECLQSDNYDTVKSGSLRFKQELKKILTDKIKYYNECLGNLNN